MKKFRDFIVCNQKVKEHLQTNLLKIIADHRVECPLEPGSLKSIPIACEMLFKLSYKKEDNIYKSIFEQGFLKQSGNY